MLCFFQWFVCRVSRKVGLLNWRRRNQKLHAAVAKSPFWSENAQNTAWLEHFLKFWCRRIARRCGQKHILKWKCTKHVRFGTLSEVLMSKNCTPLWRKAHFEVKMHKTHGARSTFWSSDVKIARRCGEKRKCTKHVSSGQFFEVLMSKNWSGSKFVSYSQSVSSSLSQLAS